MFWVDRRPTWILRESGFGVLRVILFWRDILLGVRVKYFILFCSWFLDVFELTVDKVQSFYFVLCQPFQRNIYFFVCGSILVFERLQLCESYFVGKDLWLSNNFRFAHSFSQLPQPIGLSICLILHNSQILSLHDDPALFLPPVPTFLQPRNHIILSIHISEVTDYGENSLMSSDFVVIVDKSVEESFVIEGELVLNSSEMLLILDERVGKQSKVQRFAYGFLLRVKHNLVRLAQFFDGLYHYLHTIKQINTIITSQMCFIIITTFLMNSKISNPNNKPDQVYHVECKFDRSNASYKPEEIVTGHICLAHATDSTFRINVESIRISVWGGISAQSRQSKPQTQEIVRRVAPITIIKIPQMLLAQSKTLTQDTKIPFRFKLQKGQNKYFETYIGVYLSISYNVKVKVKVSSLRTIQQEAPFYVQVPKAGRDTIDNFIHPKKKNFMVVTGDIKGEKGKVPIFKIRGELESQIIFFNDDLNGSIIIDLADSPIRSIDLQMLRVEKIETNAKSLNEKTEIQLIQICDGNVTRNLQIPLYMILPRYYSCPSVQYMWCSINFEVNLQIIFKDGYKVLVNIPLKLIRS